MTRDQLIAEWAIGVGFRVVRHTAGVQPFSVEVGNYEVTGQLQVFADLVVAKCVLACGTVEGPAGDYADVFQKAIFEAVGPPLPPVRKNPNPVRVVPEACTGLSQLVPTTAEPL